MLYPYYSNPKILVKTLHWMRARVTISDFNQKVKQGKYLSHADLNRKNIFPRCVISRLILYQQNANAMVQKDNIYYLPDKIK
jgi:hypothetical protein